MGEADRYIEYKNIRNKKKSFSLGQPNNALTALFALNVIFFLLLLTLQVVYNFYEQSIEAYNFSIVQWFEVPLNLLKLIHRPWTILSYMFSDTSAGLMRIISNLLWLLAFGRILQQNFHNEKIIPIYIYGGVSGALFFILAGLLFPQLNNNLNEVSLIGANASVLSVAFAATFLSDPNYRILNHLRNGFPVWTLLVLYIIVDSLSFNSTNCIYISAHLGGIVEGIIFSVLFKKGKDGSVWMNKLFFNVTHLFSPKPNDKKSIKQQHFYITNNQQPFNKLVNQEMIDAILDKINNKGYDALTAEEKENLKKASEDDDLL